MVIKNTLMSYIIEDRLPRKAFKQWKTERGLHFNVIPMQFLSYVKSKTGTSLLFDVEGVKYEGQRWKCKYKGKTQTFTFRVEVHEIDLHKQHRHRRVPEEKPDLISGNRMLLRLQEEKQKQLIKKLKTINSPKAKAHIDFLKSPSQKTMDALLYWRNKE